MLYKDDTSSEYSSDNLGDLIKQLSAPGEEVEMYSAICKVNTVNSNDMTVDVSPIDGKADLLGVRLVTQSGSAIETIPSEGSFIAVTFLSSATAIVNSFGVVESQLFNAEDIIEIKSVKGGEILMDSLLTIQTQNESLKSILSDLLNAIQSITVTYVNAAGAPTPTTTPLNSAAFSAIATRLDLLLKN